MPDSPQKELVTSFFTLVTSGKVREAYDTYIHPDFRHHNQYYAGDRASLLKGMEESEERFPHKKFSIKKIVEEGDTVITYSSISLGGDMPDMAVMHICRIADGKITEMWDIGQKLEADSPNENGAF